MPWSNCVEQHAMKKDWAKRNWLNNLLRLQMPLNNQLRRLRKTHPKSLQQAAESSEKSPQANRDVANASEQISEAAEQAC